jgi:hypothetical protein
VTFRKKSVPNLQFSITTHPWIPVYNKWLVAAYPGGNLLLQFTPVSTPRRVTKSGDTSRNFTADSATMPLCCLSYTVRIVLPPSGDALVGRRTSLETPSPKSWLGSGGEARLAPVASRSIIPQNLPVVGVSTLLYPLLSALPTASDKTISYRDL